MKTKLLFVCALCTFNLFSQTNLVPNAGFETWTNSTTPSNWITKNNVTQNISYFAEGSKSAKLSIANSTTEPKIIAQVPMIAGTTYTVKYKYKYLSSNFSGRHPISINISQNGSATTLSSSTFASNNKWTQEETTFKPDQSISYNLSISLFTFDAEAFDVLIDDVQVYEQGTEQYTLIPDPKFEAKLIALGIDDIADGKVLTSNVNALTSLNVSSSLINDLTGIDHFIALTSLICYNNQLTNLDVTKNIALTSLICNDNQLTNLDVTKNIALTSLKCYTNGLLSLDVTKNIALTFLNCQKNKIETLDVSLNVVLSNLICSSNKLTTIDTSSNILLTYFDCAANSITAIDVNKNILLTNFYCHYNQITNLDTSKNVALDFFMCHFNKLKNIDVSKNTELTIFDCLNNEITSIDISNNPKIYEIACENNQLTYLNLKNGNNVNFDEQFSNFLNNPNLKCIIVDDVNYSNTNWASKKDNNASYASNCNLGLGDSIFNKVTLSPNPTQDKVNISNISLEKATVYNSIGQLVKSFTFSTSDTNNTINLSSLPKGVYYVYLINQDTASVKKIIVE